MQTPILTHYLDRLQNGKLRITNKPVRLPEPSKHPLLEKLLAVVVFGLILYSLTQVPL